MTVEPTNECEDIVERWGVISDGWYVAEYQTRQPDPGHWIAVSVITTPESAEDARRFPRMLVGAGRTEEAAIHDLELRLVSAEPATPA